jgi:hypothetical protein
VAVVPVGIEEARGSVDVKLWEGLGIVTVPEAVEEA